MSSSKIGNTVFIVGAALILLLFLLAAGNSPLGATTGQAPADEFVYYLPFIRSNDSGPPPQATPTPTSTPTTTPTSTPTTMPDPVVILPNHSTYTSIIGTMYVVGEIQNNSQDYVRFVKLTMNVFDKDGKLLGSDSPLVSMNVVNPGEKACFKASLDEPDGWDQYAFSDLNYNSEGEPLTGLVVANHSGVYKPELLGRYVISGQLRNESSQTTKFAKAVGTIYNASNTVIGCATDFIDGFHLNPGQMGSFEIIFGGRDYVDFDSYKIEASGTPE